LKRLICALCALLILFAALPVLAFSPDEDVNTQYVALVEANSGALLFGKNQDDKAFPASTTKIMTCILALEKGNLDDTVTCGNEVSAFGSHSSLMGLRPGEKLTLRDLIYGMMLISGNDAAAAIAVHIAGSTDKFVDMMNSKAASLNMTKTHFVSPEGRHNEDHYTTAADMAKLAIYAMNTSPKSQDFRAIANRKTYNISPTNKNKNGYQLESSNRLIYTKADAEAANVEYPYAVGIKTGETNEAGYCLASAAEKDGVTLILVQYKSKDADSRFTLAKQLFDWGFSHYTKIDASSLNLPATVEVSVKNCSFDDETGGLLKLNVDMKGKEIACLSEDLDRLKNNVSAVTTSIATAGDITAPVKEGDKLATVTYKFEGKTLFTADAYASRSVEQMGGGVVQTPNGASLMQDPVPGSTKTAGPWLFIVLVAALIILLVSLVNYLHHRKQTRRRKAHRVTYAYRGRR